MDYAHSQEGTTGHIMHERNGVFLRHRGSIAGDAIVERKSQE